MDDIDKIIESLEKEIKILFSSDNSGHDIYHLRRTLNIALHLQEKEGGDRFIIAVASFLHDVHRIIQNETGKFCSPEESLPKVKEVLEKAKINDPRNERVLECIRLHEEYNFSNSGKTAKDIEALIVQDADNLDAMGAVGIARVFAYGGAHDVPIWKPEAPLPEGNWDEGTFRSVSQIHHFYEKLLRLKDNMNTDTGKKIALERHGFMENYLKEFFKEWKGEK